MKLVGLDPVGLHRVLDQEPVLPQAARRLDASSPLAPDEVRIDVKRLNLDAASLRQLREKHHDDGAAVRQEVLEIIETRGKMQNPVTRSGGMLLGTVAEVGPLSSLGLRVGDQVATLVSLSLTPLRISDGLREWDGLTEQVPCHGDAILFGRSIAAVLPNDLPAELALAVFDVCGAPALTSRVVRGYQDPLVAVLGAGGKSGSLSAVAARTAGATKVVGVVPTLAEQQLLERAALCDDVVLADATNPIELRNAVTAAFGRPADVVVVCVDVPGCEGGAILATAQGGTIIFFSMATDFAAAALGAEGVAADITMLIGNGYVPGHGELALDLIRSTPKLRDLFESRHR